MPNLTTSQNQQPLTLGSESRPDGEQAEVMTYKITYTGMDRRKHTEIHHGNEASKNKLITFLEERGAHCIETENENF